MAAVGGAVFFLIGLSYGSFMLTLPYFVFGRKAYERLGASRCWRPSCAA
jgi:Ni/Fe-hydrogenase subunit HybB-like protein